MAAIFTKYNRPGCIQGAMLTSIVYLLLGGLLAIFVHITLEKVIQAQANVAQDANISGQQRMLLQRASLFATAYLYSEDIAAKQTSLQALGTMQANHQLLLEPHYSALKNGLASPLSPELQALYFTSDNNVSDQLNAFGEQIYYALSLQVKQGDTKLDAKALMEMAYTPLLSSLNAVVSEYESQNSIRMTTLRLVQLVVFWLIVAIMFIGLIVILLNARKQRQNMTISSILNLDQEHASPMFTRKAFELSARKLIATARRHNETISVLAFDIDRFARILTHHGHEAAEDVLSRVADGLLAMSRESDYLGRVADEKFVLLLPKTSAEQALNLANKIRTFFNDEKTQEGAKGVPISVSIGITELEKEDSMLQHIISRAENALVGKESQGNARVCMA
ncbi:GGDEF domain-containing protein [Paraglaciecola chathamensis]|uniref:GGDEF domain-containing protein n=1 Tax=Paraglaciecola chathamensis TaxID=368405 RepID=UPI002709C547|nr:GGDEF domain-containing protein [Paraglaciecola chathamensis]MDO6840027.1 GGDEF domain-containing protein [Paraglaciecola chathamensis]